MKIKFSAIVELPDNVSIDEVTDWLRFNLGNNGSLSLDNPLSDTDLASVGCNQVDVWKW